MVLMLRRRQAVPALRKRLLLEHGEVRVECTPRRLAVLVPGLASRQPDTEEDIRGPPAKASLFVVPAKQPPCMRHAHSFS